MQSVSRNAQVLRYLLALDPGVGRTKLAKYAYLADLVALQYLGKPISAFRYRFDRHGPFDSRAFFEAKVELENAGLATESEVAIGPYLEHSLYPTDRALEYGFTIAEARVLDYVAQTYLSMNARALCEDVVYQTLPMKKAKPGRLIPMGLVTGASTPLGFDLERMIMGEESADARRATPLHRAADELRARAH